eukprot:scaffold254245_cov34-Prasinocladus_malaysianus.AAC.1
MDAVVSTDKAQGGPRGEATGDRRGSKTVFKAKRSRTRMTCLQPDVHALFEALTDCLQRGNLVGCWASSGPLAKPTAYEQSPANLLNTGNIICY